MAPFKCKMCGASLEVDAGATVAKCEYCGTQQTLPRLDDEKRANLYDRANHFRRNNDFDKASGIYEQILNEQGEDAEAYWSLVLCRYGIEYVEDPASHKRIPTVNRAQFTSIFDDENYKSALQYADENQRSIYEAEAEAINEIQKGILAISQREEPFDVFVCYKETDNNGRRTQDSVLAQELYYQLKQEGFKVFFSRITLEDKLGIAYEPYIFAALNSAKVMVVLGTRPEHFNAVWVKNEWSRYLALIKNGAKKTLIPAYRDMDPYDLPEEFSHLQAQDMAKLGFMQDLTRGIKKIMEADAPKATVKETIVETVAAINVAPLLKRAFMFLEDGDFDRADEFCEQVLNQDPENAGAYLAKLMADLHVKKQESLANCAEPFDHNRNYQKAIRFADEKLKETLIGYIEHINIRNENDRLEDIYIQATSAMRSAKEEAEYKKAANAFKTIRTYKDSEALIAKCLENAETARKDAILSFATSKIERNTIVAYEEAITLFASVSGWKDADEQIVACRQKIQELKVQAEAERLEKERLAEIARIEEEKRSKLSKRIAIITTPIVCAIIAFIVVLYTVTINRKYNDAIALMDAEKYTEAIKAFEALNGYKDSDSLLNEIKNGIKEEAKELYLAGDAAGAAKLLATFGIKDPGYGYVASGAYKEAVSAGLTHIVIPAGVTTIGDEAFFACRSLTSVTIPDSVTTIGYRAFHSCSSLTSVTIPDSVTTIGDGAFSYCVRLTSVTIGDSVTTIGDYAFCYCDSLTSVTIPDSVTSIGGWAFSNCSSLTSITIPDSVTTIGKSVFYRCSSLTDIVVHEKNEAYCSIDGNLYTKDGKTLVQYAIGKPQTSFTIPAGVTTIGDEAFFDCPSLTSVTIGDSVTSIGRYAFSGRSSLTSVTFEDTSTWYRTISSSYTGGYSVNVTDPARNATYLRSTYCDDYWYKK